MTTPYRDDVHSRLNEALNEAARLSEENSKLRKELEQKRVKMTETRRNVLGAIILSIGVDTFLYLLGSLWHAWNELCLHPDFNDKTCSLRGMSHDWNKFTEFHPYLLFGILALNMVVIGIVVLVNNKP